MAYVLPLSAKEVEERLTKIPALKDEIAEQIVDKQFNPESTNAQSGIAVAEAIECINEELKNFVHKSETENETAIVVGGGHATGDNSTVIGTGTASGNNSVVIGNGIAYGDSSVSIGQDTISGCMGFYWYSVDGNTLTLSSKKDVLYWDEDAREQLNGWESGDSVSFVNDIRYVLKSTIISINNTDTSASIEFDELPFTKKEVVTNPTDLDYSIINPYKPGYGSIPFGFASFSAGVNNAATGYASASLGELNIAAGDWSFAEGTENVVKGTASHAEGSNNIAAGGYSHAEGCYTKTDGAFAHAEGYRTTAEGNYSHAEGGCDRSNTTTPITRTVNDRSYDVFGPYAFGPYSHAESNRTFAYGSCSHAEGQETQAVGQTSHAEGYQSIASGKHTHAEGHKSRAYGDYSHAEGVNTKAYAGYSHAEGWDTQTRANATASHVEGKGTIALDEYQHVEGKYNRKDTDTKYAHILGNGTGDSDEERSNAHTIDWSGNAWFAGNIEADGSICAGNVECNNVRVHNAISVDGNITTESALYVGTALTADDVHTSSITSSLDNTYSFDVREIATIFDVEDKISTALDETAGIKQGGGEIFNDYANNKAIGSNSHVEGGCNSLVTYNLTGGAGVTTYSTTTDLKNIVVNDWFVKDDTIVYVTGIDTVNKTITVSETLSNVAISKKGFKRHRGALAKGSYSHVEGRNNTALGIAAHAEGNNTLAQGDYSHSEGDNRTTASGKASHAEGLGTAATQDYQHVQGKYNYLDDTGSAGDYAHVVGNGTTTKRSNAHALDWNGNAYFAGDVYVGSGIADDRATRLPRFYYGTEDDIDSTLGNIGDIYIVVEY